jgi:hypothetical protein
MKASAARLHQQLAAELVVHCFVASCMVSCAVGAPAAQLLVLVLAAAML